VDTKRSHIVRTQSDRTTDFGSYLAARELAGNRESPESPHSPQLAGSPLLNHSHTFSCRDGRDGKRLEMKRREAVWDLFQSESAFLRDHLMTIKNVFMEPLKKVQVEGFVMFAEPEVLFGNLDELCCVTYSFCKEFASLLTDLIGPEGDLPVVKILTTIFEQAANVSKAFHRYALNYINALNYLETLRRQQEFSDFEKVPSYWSGC
jgi:hypothetical protein